MTMIIRNSPQGDKKSETEEAGGPPPLSSQVVSKELVVCTDMSHSGIPERKLPPLFFYK